MGDVTIEWLEGGAGDVCRRILAMLPSWFGIPEANEGYADMADRHPTAVASVGGDPIGLLTLVTHSPAAGEVHLVAVDPGRHRQGVGHRLLAAAETRLRDAGGRFLQVKTLSAASDDVGYAKTRRFYEAEGFVVLEEMPDLWDPSNPAVIMIKTVAA